MKNIFENLKKADIVLICFAVIFVVVLALVGLKANKFLSKTPVLEERNIAFTVFFRGITITNPISPFVKGDEAFITIRNVPYTKLKIIDVQSERRKILLETAQKGNYQPVEDISSPCLFDFAVTLTDKAKITNDGAVVGGNKIKMGIPVVLEGKTYKFTGVVSNIMIEQEEQKTDKQ